MKTIFAADIRENDNVDTVFLVKSKSLAVGRTGKPYLSVSLMDKTGDMEGRVWDDAERFASGFETDDFAAVKAKAVSYMGKLQLKITSIRRVDDSEAALGDFLPIAKRDPEKMFADLKDIVSTTKDKFLKALIRSIMDDKTISANLKTAPAAKGMHHVYIGGLLEHVLSLCKLVDLVSGHYGKEINRDLLLAGAVLHDIGKTRELSYSRSFGYTDEGRLVGHITIGVEILEDKIRNIDGFPQELAILLKHMILSHHGEYEYGSPKRPKTLEATILSYLDDLDAKVNSIQCLIEKDSGNGSGWTSFHRLFNRYIYKGNCLPVEKDETAKEEAARQDDPEKGRMMSLFDA